MPRVESVKLAWNHKLTIQQATIGNQGAGETPVKWDDLRTNVAARVEPLTGREQYQAKQMEATVSHRIVTPYFAGATPKLRLVRKEVDGTESRTFNVKSVVDVEERQRWLEWMCEEVF